MAIAPSSTPARRSTRTPRPPIVHDLFQTAVISEPKSARGDPRPVSAGPCRDPAGGRRPGREERRRGAAKPFVRWDFSPGGPGRGFQIRGAPSRTEPPPCNVEPRAPARHRCAKPLETPIPWRARRSCLGSSSRIQVSRPKHGLPQRGRTSGRSDLSTWLGARRLGEAVFDLRDRGGLVKHLHSLMEICQPASECRHASRSATTRGACGGADSGRRRRGS
jgi:hypothetical protein